MPVAPRLAPVLLAALGLIACDAAPPNAPGHVPIGHGVTPTTSSPTVSTNTPHSGALVFQRAPDEATLRRLEALGVDLGPTRGRGRSVAGLGEVVAARLSADAMAEIQRLPGVRFELDPRVMLADAGMDSAPLLSQERHEAWGLWTEAGERVNGAGVTVGDIDGSIDVFHPAFFNADGGVYPFVDADGDGVLTPDVDLAPLGEAPGGLFKGHPLRVLKGVVHWQSMAGTVQTDNTSWTPFDPRVDWLYADLNNNGKRDFGVGWMVEGDFDDATPAFGEPLFYADDVDGDGVLQAKERLVRLGSSKIAAVYHAHTGQTYRRGVNLIDTPRPTESYSHGTMTVGTMAGGDPRYHQYGGAAYGVDILFADIFTGADPYAWGDPVTPALMWLQAEGADVLMFEFGTAHGVHGDGSSAVEQLMDSFADEEGVPSVTAAHNFAGMDGHARVELGAYQTVQVPFEVIGSWTRYATISARWQVKGPDPVLNLKVAGGEVVELDEVAEVTALQAGYELVNDGREVSERGTALQVFSLSSSSDLPGGTHTLTLTNTGSGKRVVDLWIAGEIGYAYEVSFLSHVTDAGTAAYPSTADTALTVGGYRANTLDFQGEQVGELYAYSGQGPRIDGAAVVDVVAPSDGVAAAWQAGLPEASFSTGSGTSGSLPHVVAAVALLKSQEPELSPAEIKARIHDSGRADAFTGALPNDAYGFGKLSLFGLLSGEAPDEGNTPPQAVLSAPTSVPQKGTMWVDVAASKDEAGTAALKVRYDIGYDGIWDTPWLPALAEIPFPGTMEVGPVSILAEVRDPQGATSRRVAVIDVYTGVVEHGFEGSAEVPPPFE